MENINDTPLSQFKWSRILFPVLFSVGVAVYMLHREYDVEKLQKLSFHAGSWVWILACFVCMALRDVGYIWRMHLLANGEMKLRSSFETTMLWEFSNTLAPSLTGGTPLVIWLLTKEKISGGKSTAIVFLTILFDQAFFVVFAPIVLAITGWHKMFEPLIGTSIGASLTVSFWLAYSVLFAYNSLLFFGIFVNPYAVKRLIIWVFHWKLFKKWKHLGEKVGDDLIAASENYRNQPFSYWLQLILSTVFAWASRFFVLNCLLSAFSPEVISLSTHGLAFSRQFVLFVLMFFAITPGGSGFAEVFFIQILDSMCPTPPGGGSLALIWRLIGYYPYMLLGIWLLPRWIHRVFK
ncbi:MAG: lysylphosphatidylglycerol synthase transmembrane domain-containing protein [Bacteroidia bacterium]